MVTIRWKIFGANVDFVDCSEVSVEFRRILTGWDIDEIPFDENEPAYLTFKQENGLYFWNAPWIADDNRSIDPTSDTVMDAVCNFHYEFIDWFVDRHPELFCLHTASVKIGNSAILFPCVQKAGKSTLSMQLVQRGHRLLGDDVVCLSEDGRLARALGLAPRLRLPLPERVLSADVIDFINQRRGLTDEYWQYVNLGIGEISPLNETHEIGGIIVLERGNDIAATLEEIPKSLALKALIDQNFGRMKDPNGIFDSLKALALRVPCKALKYSRPEDAAILLEHHFGN